MRADVNKGLALEFLQKRLGLAPDQCLAFGDYPHDLEMIRQAGFSYAMANSHPDLLAAAGFTNAMGRDFLYAFNILAALGQSPEVSYIPNTRLEVFESFEDALSGLSGIVRDAVKGLANDDELEEIPHRLESWLNDNLVEGEKGFHLKHPRNVTWAFIAWKTC